jgi:hypothetical protein
MMPLSAVYRWEDRVLVCGPTWFAYRARLLRLAFLFDALKAVDLFEMIEENWKNSRSKTEIFCTAFSFERRCGD